MPQKTPKLVTYDIETAPDISLAFQRYNIDSVAKVVQEGHVLGFAWKELGKKRVHSCYIWDFLQTYKKDPHDTSWVAKKWLEVVEYADVMIGHNSISFDNKMMMAEVIKNRLDPPAPFQSFDTKNSIKRVARFGSNKLDDLGELFGIGRKMKHEGIDLWWACMNGDLKAQKKMVRYNKQDVVLTEKLYLYERPYALSHPALNTILSLPEGCPRCGKGPLVKQGTRTTKTATYQQYKCRNCQSWPRSRLADFKQAEERMQYV